MCRGILKKKGLFMAKMTVREFAKSVGLTTSGADYIACTVMLKVLCSKGVAKEVDRINTSASGRGRKSVVYEIPEQVSFGLDTTAAFAAPVAAEVEPEVSVVETGAETPEFTVEAVTKVTPVEEEVAEATVAVVEAGEKFCYDDDEDEAEAA
jgi:hypothetical protein